MWVGVTVMETDEGGSRWKRMHVYLPWWFRPNTHTHTHTHTLAWRCRVRVTSHAGRLDRNRWIHAQTHQRVSRRGWQGPDLSDRGRGPGGQVEQGLCGWVGE